jgi:hypothetical protein
MLQLSLTPKRRAAAGMSCIKPFAPLADTAQTCQFDSTPEGICKSLILLAFPTGLEPVLSP